MLKWEGPDYPGGRIVALSGNVEVGAVFSPFPEGQWRWLLFLGGGKAATSILGQSGKAKTELGAKNAVCTAWTSFLMRAALKEDR